jgi:ADP-ribosylglycohydrolase
MFRQSLTSAEAAIALLPVFLFFHEDFAKLRKNVENVTELWQNSPISTRDLLAIGYTLSQALQERLDPRELIPQLLTATVGLPEGITHLQRLQKIDILIQQNVGLDEAVQTILTLSDTTTGDAAIALAMYCFLSTASDFRISVLRASRTGYQVPIVAALAGMLSGAYNSTIGFPLEWRLPVPHQSKISHISSQLLAQWSGIYSVGDRPESILLPVAAPQVIRKV